MNDNVVDYERAFTTALRAGDELSARAVVATARAAGHDPNHIYFSIFAPSMVTIGQLWEQNQLSVAEEHLATAITERLISELSPWFSARGAVEPGGSVILGGVAGEQHVLGLRMIADLFRRQGWRVLYLGADVPTVDWVVLAQRFNADLVAISAGALRHVPQIGALIHELRSALPELDVLVGGTIFAMHAELWREVGATIFDPDPATAVRLTTERYRQRMIERIGQ